MAPDLGLQRQVELTLGWHHVDRNTWSQVVGRTIREHAIVNPLDRNPQVLVLHRGAD